MSWKVVVEGGIARSLHNLICECCGMFLLDGQAVLIPSYDMAK